MKFIVTSSMPSKITTASDLNLLGTPQFPIQLVQSGNDFQTLQPLQYHQVKQITKMLRQSGAIQNPSFIYDDISLNRRLVYKLMNEENARGVARNASAASHSCAKRQKPTKN